MPLHQNERVALAASTKRFVYDEIYYVIKLVRESKSSAIAELIMQMFLHGLRNGFVRGIPFPLTTVADRLMSSFSRVMSNGSIGLWRYSDVFHEHVTMNSNYNRKKKMQIQSTPQMLHIDLA